MYVEFLPLALQGENQFDRDVSWFSLWPVSALACLSICQDSCMARQCQLGNEDAEFGVLSLTLARLLRCRSMISPRHSHPKFCIALHKARFLPRASDCNRLAFHRRPEAVSSVGKVCQDQRPVLACRAVALP